MLERVQALAKEAFTFLTWSPTLTPCLCLSWKKTKGVAGQMSLRWCNRLMSTCLACLLMGTVCHSPLLVSSKRKRRVERSTCSHLRDKSSPLRQPVLSASSIKSARTVEQTWAGKGLPLQSSGLLAVDISLLLKHVRRFFYTVPLNRAGSQELPPSVLRQHILWCA